MDRRTGLKSMGAAGLALAFGMGLSACSAMAPGPRTVEVSEARLAEMLARHFPVDTRYMELFDVSLTHPRLRLLPAQNRIATQMDYTLGSALTGGRSLQGLLELSYGLRFEPSDGTLRLDAVRVERFDVPGVPVAQQPRVSRLGGVLAESVLQDAVVHRLRPEQLQTLAGWGYEPGPLQVVPGGVRLTLMPVKR
ncbi:MULTISPECIES: DUF1439 domain-containing protein [Hydrogenophaga]|nr:MULTISPECIES: DUF1439 domain-containing protein [Hydrogenophaga]